MRKIFREPKISRWDILEKDLVDEMIFRTRNRRNRLMLELMVRGGMRVGEVLKLTPADITDRKLQLRDPKSGKEREFIFIPQKIADRLKEYIRVENIKAGKRIFPICYEAARAVVKKSGLAWRTKNSLFQERTKRKFDLCIGFSCSPTYGKVKYRKRLTLNYRRRDLLSNE